MNFVNFNNTIFICHSSGDQKPETVPLSQYEDVSRAMLPLEVLGENPYFALLVAVYIP
jgi:hypothetical protein